MDGAAVEAGPGRLQDVEQRDAVAVRMGGEERVVRRADQPPVVGIGQRRRRRIGLEVVAVERLARHPHGDAVGERTLGIARAHPALGELGDVARHQGEAGAGAGRQIGRTARAALAGGDAFEPAEEVAQEVGGLLHALPVEAQPGCTSTPSVGSAPHTAPFSSYWIGS